MSSVISKGADALVRGKFYSTKSELFDDALKTFFEFKKDMRIAAVVELYKTDEMSLSRAAELAGVSTEEMKDHLAKAGVRIRRGSSNDKGKELAMLVQKLQPSRIPRRPCPPHNSSDIQHTQTAAERGHTTPFMIHSSREHRK